MILYWDKYQLWLSIIIDPQSLNGAISKPQFLFRNKGFVAPSWYQQTDSFKEDAIEVWYVVGHSDRTQATQRTNQIFKSLNASNKIQLSPVNTDGSIQIAQKNKTAVVAIKDVELDKKTEVV